MSRIYSNELTGIVRADSEYIVKEDVPSVPTSLQSISHPLLTGPVAVAEVELQVATATNITAKNQQSGIGVQRSTRTKKPTRRLEDVGTRVSWISRFYYITNSYASFMPYLCPTLALLNLPNNYVFVIYHTSPWVKLVSTNEMFYLL